MKNKEEPIFITTTEIERRWKQLNKDHEERMYKLFKPLLDRTAELILTGEELSDYKKLLNK